MKMKPRQKKTNEIVEMEYRAQSHFICFEIITTKLNIDFHKTKNKQLTIKKRLYF